MYKYLFKVTIEENGPRLKDDQSALKPKLLRVGDAEKIGKDSEKVGKYLYYFLVKFILYFSHFDGTAGV